MKISKYAVGLTILVLSVLGPKTQALAQIQVPLDQFIFNPIPSDLPNNLGNYFAYSYPIQSTYTFNPLFNEYVLVPPYPDIRVVFANQSSASTFSFSPNSITDILTSTVPLDGNFTELGVLVNPCQVSSVSVTVQWDNLVPVSGYSYAFVADTGNAGFSEPIGVPHTFTVSTPPAFGICNFFFVPLDFILYQESADIPTCDPLLSPCPTITITNITYTKIGSIPTTLPPISSQDSPTCQGSSSVNINSLALLESIPLVGVPFSLNYASDRFRTGVNFAPTSLGLGGWTPSIVHHYDPAGKIVYYGDGSIRNITAVPIAGGYYTTDSGGTEVYYFNSSGVHTSTKDALTGITKFNFNYNSSGQISSIVDQFGNSTTFNYASSMVTMTSPYGQASTISLDSNGFLASASNPNHETYLVSNSSSGLMQTFTKPMGQQSKVTYNSAGLVTQDLGAGGNFLNFTQNINASGAQTVTESTALNRTTTFQTSTSSSTNSTHQIIGPDGGTSQYTSNDIGINTSTDEYGDNGSYTTVNDPRFGALAPYAQSSSYSVPNSNIQISSSISKMATLQNSSDPLSLTSLVTTTELQSDPSRVYTTSYNAASKLITNLSPLNRVNYGRLNSQGQLTSIQTGGLLPVNLSYDSRGRLSQIAQANIKSVIIYNQLGNVSEAINTLGQKTKFEYDLAGRVTTKILPDSSEVKMTYDLNGNMISLTPPGRPSHTFNYNLMELVSEYLPPALSLVPNPATFYSYNLDKQLTQVTRPDGSVVAYNYDSATGLLSSINTPTGNYTYIYRANTNLVSTLTSPDSEVLNYQYAGKLPISISESGAISSGLSFSYNSDGTIASTQVSSAAKAIPMTYDKDGLVIGVLDESFVRNNFGAISQASVGSIIESLSYDNFGAIIDDSFKSGKKEVFELNIKRDNLGRIISSNDRAYTYDPQGRLTKVSDGSRMIHEYEYDQNGNRIGLLSDNQKINAEYDDQDRLTKYGNTGYEYNANGDLTEKSEQKHDQDDWWCWIKHKIHWDQDELQVTKYSFDVFGNLKLVTLPNGRVIEYIVDGQNRRIGKKVNGKFVKGFVYQNQTQIIAELDNSGKVTKQFIYGEKSNSPDLMLFNGKEYRIISDQVGTPKMLIDTSTGKIVRKFDFDEFGVTKDHWEDDFDRGETMNIPFGFAGGLFDRSTGFVRFGAREYDPETGKWLSKDPLLFGGGNTNLYSYSLNDPINFIDKSGQFPTNPDEAGICLFGNFDFQVSNLQANIDANNATIAAAQRIVDSAGNSCSSGTSQQNALKTITQYQQQNKSLQLQLDALIKKCKWFPTF